MFLMQISRSGSKTLSSFTPLSLSRNDRTTFFGAHPYTALFPAAFPAAHKESAVIGLSGTRTDLCPHLSVLSNEERGPEIA